MFLRLRNHFSVLQGDYGNTSYMSLPDEIWLYIFSFLTYHQKCTMKLVCRRFYSIGNDHTLLLQPPWSRLNVQKRRIIQFEQLLQSSHLPLDHLKKLSWKGIPNSCRSTAIQLLLGYLPLCKGERESHLHSKREQYKELQKNRSNDIRSEVEEEFGYYLDKDLPRFLIPNNPHLLSMVKRALQLFNAQYHTSYHNIGFSIHFPIVQAAYIENVIKLHHIPPEEQDIMKILLMNLPKSTQDEIEADFYWSFELSYQSLKDQGKYTEGNRINHSFILKMLSKVDQILTKSDPALVDHFLQQGIFGNMYLHSWISTVFNHSFPLETVLRFWDTLLSERKNVYGLSMELVVYLCAGIVLTFANTLKTIPSDDILEVLRHYSNTLNIDTVEMVLAKAYFLQLTEMGI